MNFSTDMYLAYKSFGIAPAIASTQQQYNPSFVPSGQRQQHMLKAVMNLAQPAQPFLLPQATNLVLPSINFPSNLGPGANPSNVYVDLMTSSPQTIFFGQDLRTLTSITGLSTVPCKSLVNAIDCCNSTLKRPLELGSTSEKHQQSSSCITPRKKYKQSFKLCQAANCTKYAQGGTPFCVSHGGGRRCQVPGCKISARGRSGFCIRHGGGKRCIAIGCTKSAIGATKFCVKHGGGRRCKVEGCDKSAQGSTHFCVKHGGGRICVVPGCFQYARSRSIHCNDHVKRRK